MAHSCRWRFPARPGTGRKLGARQRLPALLQPATGAALPAPGPLRVGPGFDAALQVSAAIGSNLRRFLEVLGGSGGEEEQFLGFGSDEEVKLRSPTRFPTRSPSVKHSPRKPRGRPPRTNSVRNLALKSSPPPAFPTLNKSEPKPAEKIKRNQVTTGEKRRGRPPTLSSVKFRVTQEKKVTLALPKGDKSERETLKKVKRIPSAAFQQAAKIKKLRTAKLSPLKSKFKSRKLQLGRKGGVPVVRRRGRPPSSERSKAVPSALLLGSQLEKHQKIRREKDGVASLTKEEKAVVRQSPRRIKPVRIIPATKRTDATIAKQLLQRAKKGAQKKIEKEAAKLQGRKGRTQLKTIRQFIMPVVSAISSRIIKTPKRFIEDEDYDPPVKISRLESMPNNRFNATSCGSSEKSSAMSQHSSQMSSDSSRSSSPSVDTSTDSQASEEMQGLLEEQSHTPEEHTPSPVPQTSENEGVERRSRRFSVSERSYGPGSTKRLTSQPVSQQISSSPPPPLLTPPPPLQPPSSISEHTPWLMPPTIPLASPFLPSSAAPMQEKRRSILREPTFKWTSLKHSRLEPQYFSSAKYAKEGLIRKPIFDNFRPPPLTPEDVGLASASGFSPSSAVGPGRLFSALHGGTRFDVHKRSPLLRAPRFTPSEAHSRIFESVTLPSVGRSSGQSAGIGMSSRRRKRGVFSPMRSESRSPSHSMRTRSGRLSNSDLTSLTSQSSVSSSLTSISVSSLTTSALNSTFTFSSSSLTPSGESSEKSQRPRKQTSTPGGEPFSSSSPTPLFPWFTQTERGRNKDITSEELSREKDIDKSQEKDKSRDKGREREKEKENKRRSKKGKRKKGMEIQSSTALFSMCRASKDKASTEDTPASSSTKKAPGRKKAVMAETVTDIPAAPLFDTAAGKIKLKKCRGGPEKVGPEPSTAAQCLEKEKTPSISMPSSTLKHSTASISTMLAQADKLPVTDKRVASLLKKAKAQLYKIEKNKSLKQADQPKAQAQESDSSETSMRGPRIKHVCRRAAVALGRKRAVFPDDMPTLSALPWEEREKILSSMGNDDKSSIAGSEDAEPLAPPIKPIKPVTRNKTPQEPPVKKGRRSRRCGQCPGCQVPEDCGVCTNCLDKPKFGGRNIKKQCCKQRKCQNLQWMPSKAYLQKQAKAVKKKEKRTKSSEKKESHSGKNPLESGREDGVQKKNDSLRKTAMEKSEDGSSTVPAVDPKSISTPVTRKNLKQAPLLVQPLLPPQLSPGLAKKETLKSPSEPKKKQPTQAEPGMEQSKQKKGTPRPGLPVKQKPKEKEKPLPVSKPESSTLSLLNTLANGSSSKQRPPADGVHRIRVDFKEDCDMENVWEMGGLSILTSVPITPRVVCFLCASSGHLEFVYCQVCCEPFHRFCLEESERPIEDQLENWCCRRCKFCHVCGRQHQATKQLLECSKCRNSYHPECLGPNYPTKPTKKKKVWICTKCVHCKSCGATTPGKGWDAQWSHDFSLCHDCAKLFAKGNFCPLCDKCYDDDDYESKMMQCGKCERWVHSKCENLSDEMYEILSNLPESVAYTCINCTDHHPAEWRLALGKELQSSLKQVLMALLNSRTTSHLLRYRQTAKPPDLNPETEESIPSRSSPEGPDPPVLTQVSKQEEQQLLDLEAIKKKMDQGGYVAVLEFSDDIVKIIQAAINSDGGQPELKKANSMVKSFFIRQMERVFPWFSVKKSRFWEPNKLSNNSGMLPNAVLPPSLDHNYAQWQEREENGQTIQPPLMKKIIPAPKARGPGEPDSPMLLHPPTPPASSFDRSREDSPELHPPPGVEDNRQCALCLKYGDDNANDSGRLLYIGQNEWTHVNCALWSAEVFEDDDGSLKNVHMAVIRGKQLRCELCLKPGATVGCCLTCCTSNYHFMCSRTTNCVFLDDKKVYCQRHRDLIKGEMVTDNGFEVLRRVFVDFEGISLRRKFLNGLEPDGIHMMIGSMTIDCLGLLNDLSDCEDKLFPIGYQCSRVYWSTTDARKRCVYTCKIMEYRPPAMEPDINSTVQHDENRTIAHSPAILTEVQSKESQVAAECLTPASSSQICKNWASSRPVGSRIRTPSYSPAQRSSGSRPLPSAGSPTPVPHEIVTVGDPVLSSGLRSIGSRRHSTSSLSPQQSKLRMISPTRAGNSYSRHSVSSISVFTGSSSDHESNAKSTENFLGSFHSNTSSTVGPSSTISCCPKMAVSKDGGKNIQIAGSHSSDIKYSCALDLLPKSISKIEKARLSNSKNLEHSVPDSKVSAQSDSTLAADSDVSKSGTLPDPPTMVFNSQDLPASQSSLTRGSRNDKDQHVASSHADKANLQVEDIAAKNLQPSGVHSISCVASEQALSSPKNRRQKGKKPPKENVKEMHFNKSSVDSNHTVANNEGKHLEFKLDNPSFSNENTSQRLVNNVSGEKTGDNKDSLAHSPNSQQVETKMISKEQPPRKRTVKVTLTPLKMETDSLSKRAVKETTSESLCHSSEPAALVKPSSSSECPADDPVDQLSSASVSTKEPQVGNAYINLPDQERNLMLQDGNKTQEDSSYKRRYPRRSARARSNMFFGLTPLYGVRSYGEEDIPFYSNSSGKKRGKRSAEGQVDGADDLSTSSDEDDVYYYSFSRTVISSATEERLTSRTLFREEEQCDRPKISQLDGVDDGTESDTSITATTGKVNQVSKRNGKENGTESLKLDRSDEAAEKEHVTKSSTGHKANEPKMENCHSVNRVKPQSQDSLEAQLSSLDTSRKGHTSTPSDKSILDTFNTELLKSDSDNNNSDDCGNILPSDIMDFVLKNTPSMQALGESPESSSSELLTLSEGLGLDSNRGKDMGLFEVFSQQLPSTEPVDSGVSSTISAEEQFELPLELPSDLSVLTTRSPTVPSQNHNRLAVISESQLSSPRERSILALPSTENEEKRVAVSEKSVASSEGDSALLGQGVDSTPESHLTPDPFIQSHMDTEHITSPSCGQVEQGHGGKQDLTRNSGTPSLQVPVSPTVPLQSQKYTPSSSESPSNISNAAVQTTPPHLKPTTEKLLVVNQNLQPLYVLQTLPNGVTQKIQLTPSVTSTANTMESSASVLGPIGSGVTLATGLNPSLPPAQSLFPPANKGLLPISHHSHLYSFPGTAQTGFPPNISNPASGLLIGVQPPPDPQLLISEANQRTDLGTSTPASCLNKKRPISRLHSRKNKKLAPSGSSTAVAPPDVVSNMTLINFTSSQLSGGIPNHPGLIDMGTLGNATSHRTVPNIIKRSKSGIVYFEQASLLPQNSGTSTATTTVGSSSGIIGPDASHLTAGSVSGLTSSSPVLNVVSMQATAATTSGGSVPGQVLGQSSVTLTSPGLLGAPDMGSISNLLIKASQHSLGLPEQHMALSGGSGMFSQLGVSQSPTTGAMTATSSICVLPSAHTVTMAVTQSSSDSEGPYELQQRMTQLLGSKTAIISSPMDLASPPAAPLSTFPQLVDIPGSAGLEQNKVSSSVMHASSASPGGSPSLGQQSASSVGTASTKTKQKMKRIQPSIDKGNGKKHKTCHTWTSSVEAHIPDTEAKTVPALSTTGNSVAVDSDHPKQQECGQPAGRCGHTWPRAVFGGLLVDCPLEVPTQPKGQIAVILESRSIQKTANTSEQENAEPKASEEEQEETFSSPLMFWLQQEQKRKESLCEKKPKKGLVFEISSDDGFQICAESIEDAWKSLTDKVQEARSNARLKQLSFAGVNGVRMLGIIHEAVVFLIEQLYGSKHCRNYKFRFHKPEEANEPPLNPHGSARAEVHRRKSAFDMFNFLASKHRQPPEYNPNDEEEEEVQLKSARRATSMDLPMPMRFRHLKKTSKEAVGVYRSPIHGRGLFCRRNIDAGEMVIEYSGNVIRSTLTDKREKYYDSKGIGCYMFRIDDSEVVDATMHGNAARFINHSCEPNCYSRVINIDGQKHIVIFAMRKIYRGEELTYDYKFPIEDASNKLPCNCGAKKCRRFLN
ncbi:histone-lysine N-methyltransferase 2A isoform X2 [Rhinatrema bivittatum]|uniref:histone-lysine N-methyltransferase 2A isoform X2 n=1 Tax=Rhinatrema bivittatum TaxID=194408 RepID=UPI00112DE802|nr:histone-lysine N-methyltransferase 2A isoform X2 [Rhinatrema bivittatum]